MSRPPTLSLNKPHSKGEEMGQQLTPVNPSITDVDDRNRYATLYNEFTNLVVIATFTGGVQAAVLAFFNDVLSGSPMEYSAFSTSHPESTHFTRIADLGMALGTFSVALALSVAAISSINASLVSRCSVLISSSEGFNRKKASPDVLRRRVTRCMHLQLSAFTSAAASLVTLCSLLNTPLTIAVGLAILLGVSTSVADILETLKLDKQGAKHVSHATRLVLPVSISLLEVFSRSPFLPASLAAQVLSVYTSATFEDADLASVLANIVAVAALAYPWISNIIYLVDPDRSGVRPGSLVKADVAISTLQMTIYALGGFMSHCRGLIVDRDTMSLLEIDHHKPTETMSVTEIGPVASRVLRAVSSNRSIILVTNQLGRSIISHPVPPSEIIIPTFPDPNAGPVRADSAGMLPGSITSISGDGSRYGIETRAYYHIDTAPNAVPYNLPGTNGPNPRYGGKANPPIKDNLEGLSPCSTADQGPDGTEKWGRHPEPATP